MQDSKGLMRSRTAWVAVLTIVAGALGAMLGDEAIAQHPAVIAWGGVALGVVHLVLRVLTDKPVHLRDVQNLVQRVVAMGRSDRPRLWWLVTCLVIGWSVLASIGCCPDCGS